MQYSRGFQGSCSLRRRRYIECSITLSQSSITLLTILVGKKMSTNVTKRHCTLRFDFCNLRIRRSEFYLLKQFGVLENCVK